ncbi:MAG: ImmA/IrrE family metallo-endopeptidase [Nitrospirae bacterium]|nr:ImmA/IrrE family metallo-endopeptidase [Nitrospirota bacterium]
MSDLPIKFCTHQELETIAEIFLDAFHKPKDSLPVEIDVIVEADLDIGIYPYSELQERHGLQGYLALSLKKIYVDRNIMDSDLFERRYRFTIAEEVGHYMLHKNIFADVKTPEDYIDAYGRISAKEYAKMDMDAKHLGGAILMPTELFRKESLAYATNTPGLTSDELFKYLSGVFNVSPLAVYHRFRVLGLSEQIEFDEQ